MAPSKETAGAVTQRWTAQNSEGYPSPVGLTVDVVVLTVRSGELQVLLLERPEGALALPGGFVGETETAEQTAARKLQEKTGLRDLYLEQLQTFSHPERDPRGWIPTVAFLALVPPWTQPGDPKARWAAARKPPRLAFDHNEILSVALERVAGKLWWSNVAGGVLPGPFTMAEAQEVYEAIANTKYKASIFGRDLRATGLIRPTSEKRRIPRGRPATLYEFNDKRPVWGAGRRKRVSLPG